MDILDYLFANFLVDPGWCTSSLATKTATDCSQPKVMKREDKNADPLLKKSVQSTHQPVATTPQYVAKAVPAKLKDDRSGYAGMSSAEKVRQLDSAIFAAVGQPDTTSLTQLLNAHPHAGPGPAESSAGAAIRRFFRQVASWFNSDAVAWQSRKSARMLTKAARAGNTEAVRILLSRAMDLGKGRSMVEPALKIAVECGYPETVTLLLREVLRDDPEYVKNSELTALAAYKKHASVLEALVGQGMRLPPKRCWARYSMEIHDYLLWTDATGPRKGKSLPLSTAARTTLESAHAKLNWQFNVQLNGMLHRPMNAAQRACRREGLYACSRLSEVPAETYIDAGFTADTANKMAEALNANARRFSDPEGDRATAALGNAVASEFDRFIATGKVRPDLSRYLRTNGMYGLLIELVAAACESAASSASWDQPEAKRGALFAEAMVQAAIVQKAMVEKAAHSSGDSVLFMALLNMQMELLEMFCQTNLQEISSP